MNQFIWGSAGRPGPLQKHIETLAMLAWRLLTCSLLSFRDCSLPRGCFGTILPFRSAVQIGLVSANLIGVAAMDSQVCRLFEGQG